MNIKYIRNNIQYNHDMENKKLGLPIMICKINYTYKQEIFSWKILTYLCNHILGDCGNIHIRVKLVSISNISVFKRFFLIKVR